MISEFSLKSSKENFKDQTKEFAPLVTKEYAFRLYLLNL